MRIAWRTPLPEASSQGNLCRPRPGSEHGRSPGRSAPHPCARPQWNPFLGVLPLLVAQGGACVTCLRRNGYQNGLCFSCEEPLAAELVHVDYVIPRAFLNHDESWNLVLTPSRCYLEKSARLPSRPPFSKPAAVDGLALDVSV